MKKLLLCLAAAAAASCGTVGDPTSPTSPTDTTTTTAVVYSALGASDTVGVGSSAMCLPYATCPEGKGYVQEIARRLTAAGRTVTMQNLGVPGAVLSPGLQSIANQMNRGVAINLMQDEAPFVRTDSTLVTIFTGGNDANTIGSGVKAGFGGSNVAGWAQQQIDQFGTDMKTLVSAVKTRAPKARIVILNLPNLAALPYAAGYTAQERQVLQQIAVGLNAGINATTSLGAVVVDAMCDSRIYSSANFSNDGFHPNDTGYALFADMIMPVTTSASSGTAPKSSCSFMSLY
jgi:lysophospholipase L1-like esterase